MAPQQIVFATAPRRWVPTAELIQERLYVVNGKKFKLKENEISNQLRRKKPTDGVNNVSDDVRLASNSELRWQRKHLQTV
jgi:hypothetical protein